MHTEAFNHHPGELLMYTGFQRFGRPSVGSWVAYALDSPSQNLPGYVVLTAGRAASGGGGETAHNTAALVARVSSLDGLTQIWRGATNCRA